MFAWCAASDFIGAAESGNCKRAAAGSDLPLPEIVVGTELCLKLHDSSVRCISNWAVLFAAVGDQAYAERFMRMLCGITAVEISIFSHSRSTR